jgi:CBS domain containing-hemolysin-like protein
VCEIVDEYDQEEPLVEPLGDGSMRVDAKMPIDEVNDLFGAQLPDEEWDTIGGLLFGHVGRVPLVGESVTVDGLVLKTDRVAGRRIQKVIVKRAPVTDDDSEAEDRR